jgi:hypothetical protein
MTYGRILHKQTTNVHQRNLIWWLHKVLIACPLKMVIHVIHVRSSGHIQTDGNDIRPHTAQTHNERTSTESNLVTAQSTAHEPPEDSRTYGPKHVGATSLMF